MTQKILTKYWLVVHMVVLLFAVWVSVLIPIAEWAVSLFWLSLFAAQVFLLLPSVMRGETISVARARSWGSTLQDPFVYAGVALACYALLQWLNSGCSLVYVEDTEIWRYGPPPADGLPFSVEPLPALAVLSLLVAGVVGGGILRNGVGKASKRIFLDVASMLSGGIAIYMVVMGLFKVEPYFSTWGASPGACNWGTCFGFWMLVAFGGLLNFQERQVIKTFVWSFFSLLGNLLGMLKFETPVGIALFVVAGLLLAGYWAFFFIKRSVGSIAQLKLVLCVVMAVGVTVVSSSHLFKGAPVQAKFTQLVDLPYYENLFQNRQFLSSLAWKIWQETPWRGVGAGGFIRYSQTLVEDSDRVRLEECGGFLSNDWLQFLTEYGVVGFGLFVVLVIVLLVPLFMRLLSVSRRLMASKREGAEALETDPYVTSGALAAALVLLASFLMSPLQSGAVLVSVVYVLAVIPDFLPAGVKA